MINNVNLVGNLTKEPEFKTAGSTNVLSFSIAVNEWRKDSEDYANFFDCVIFGNRAQSLSGILAKGQKVAISGRLHQERWEKDGQPRSKVSIYVNELELLSKREGGKPQQQPQPSSAYDEDIPF